MSTPNLLSRPIGEGRPGRLSLFWRAQLVGWSLFFCLDLTNRLFTYHSATLALAVSLVVLPCLVALSTGLGALYDRLGLVHRLTLRTLALVVLLSATAAALAVGAGSLARRAAGWDIPNWTPMEQLAVPWFHYVLALGAWSLCFFWIRSDRARRSEHEHAIRAEAEALRLELEELRLQLDPHFLFNALNGIAEEVPEHPQAALAMLRDLTAYLRHSLDGIGRTVVTVEAEVGGLEAYLGVQKARFGERLVVTVTVDPAARSRPIASFLLQPLVENAVKHGRRERGLALGIDIGVDGDRLVVTIANTGTLAPAGTVRRHGPGIGLANVRRRLALHYPGRHVFDLAEQDGRVVARLALEGAPCSGS
ncbi:MAG: histidine kinase [Proteobacteria bacterium]|nr:histidine kinase [Pseudomonadota bacterium]